MAAISLKWELDISTKKRASASFSIPQRKNNHKGMETMKTSSLISVSISHGHPVPAQSSTSTWLTQCPGKGANPMFWKVFSNPLDQNLQQKIFVSQDSVPPPTLDQSCGEVGEVKQNRVKVGKVVWQFCKVLCLRRKWEGTLNCQRYRESKNNNNTIA